MSDTLPTGEGARETVPPAGRDKRTVKKRIKDAIAAWVDQCEEQDRSPLQHRAELVAFVEEHSGVKRSHGTLEGYVKERLAVIDAGNDLTVEQRAKKAREYLADRDVYAIVQQEAKTSKERRAQGRARVIHNGLNAEQKALETELREMQNAKSPFEATVKVALELNKAAQYVHAVGETIDDLIQPEAVIDALHALADEITSTLQKTTNTTGYDLIDAETWQPRPVRALTS